MDPAPLAPLPRSEAPPRRSPASGEILPGTLGILSLLVVSCTPSLDPPVGDGDTLIIAVEQGPQNLLPVLAQSPVDALVADQIQVSLFDVGFDCALSFAPELATRWEFSEDGRVLSVWLRDDLRWADGSPVTSADVAEAFAVAADPAAQSPQAGALEGLDPAARPRVISPTELRFEYLAPLPAEIALARLDAVGVVPRHRLAGTADRAALATHALNRQAPLASGPWAVGTWTPTELTLERNPAFTGPADWRPRLARVVLQVIPDRAARLRALEAHEVDLVDDIPIAEIEQVEERAETVQMRRRGWRDLDMLVWNTERPPAADNPQLGPRAPASPAPHPLFGDPALRRALAAAIDTDRMIRELYTGPVGGVAFARPAIGTLSPALCGVHNDRITRIPFHPDQARAELAALGWIDTNADGWLDHGGEPFRFRLAYNADNARSEPVAVRLREDLALVGVDAIVEGVDGAVFLERLRRGDFDAALTTWTAGLYPDPGRRWAADAEYNFGHFRDARVEALLEEASRDPVALARVARDVQALVYEQQPATFLYWVDGIVGVDARFHDTDIGLLSPAHRLHRWWVPTDRIRRR